MALPTYNKSKRRVAREQLPKDAYVIKILGAKEEKWPSGDSVVRIAFDIAEGEYKGFYQTQFDRNTNEDKQWPFDAVFNLNVPNDGSQDYVWTNWNTFFADLEDSNKGFVFDGDLKKLKGKLIGGKFHIVQSKAKRANENGEYPIYENTRMKYSAVADDVRNGKAGKLPKDKLLDSGAPAATSNSGLDGFVNLPDGSDEELPF